MAMETTASSTITVLFKHGGRVPSEFDENTLKGHLSRQLTRTPHSPAAAARRFRPSPTRTAGRFRCKTCPTALSLHPLQTLQNPHLSGSLPLNVLEDRELLSSSSGPCLSLKSVRFDTQRFSARGRHRVAGKLLVQAATVDEHVLAFDIGTGGTKVALINGTGCILASGFSEHRKMKRTQQDGVAMVEQDSREWWLATQEATQVCFSNIQDLKGKLSTVKAVAVTGQMQDSIPLPKNSSKQAAPAILYSDTRAHKEAEEVNELCGGHEQLARMTGSAQGGASILAKLRWLDRHSNDYFTDNGSLLLGGHDYVVHQLCGRSVTDATTASTTGLTLVDAPDAYAEAVLETLGLSKWLEKLPEIHPVDRPCGELLSNAAEALGAPELAGIPVFHSCGDAGASTLGCGAGIPGVQYIYLGSSGWVAGSFARGVSTEDSKKRRHIPGVFTLAHPDPGLVFRTGSIMTAGGNLAWAVDAFWSSFSGDISRGQSYSRVNDLVSQVPAGANGLLYLPFLNGERCPFDDGDARAAFVGLSAATEPAHMYRAVMEGTAFAFRSARDALAGDVTSGDAESPRKLPLRLVGGGAKSSTWPLIIAGVFGQEVETIRESQEVGVKGAAILAGRWLGWHDTLTPDCGDWLRVDQRFTPEASDVQLYEKLFNSYKKLYPALRATFQELAALR